MASSIFGLYTLGSKTSWYYWFYPNTNWRSYNDVISDSTLLTVIPRPRSEVPEWSVFPARTHVVLERNGAGFRHSYRVLVENPTDSNVQFDFIVSVS